MSEALIVTLGKSILVWLGFCFLARFPFKRNLLFFFVVLTTAVNYSIFFSASIWLHSLFFITSALILFGAFSFFKLPGKLDVYFFHLNLILILLSLTRVISDWLAHFAGWCNSGMITSFDIAHVHLTPFIFQAFLFIALLALIKKAFGYFKISTFIQSFSTDKRKHLVILNFCLTLLYFKALLFPLLYMISGAPLNLAVYYILQIYYVVMLIGLVVTMFFFFRASIEGERQMLQHNASQVKLRETEDYLTQSISAIKEKEELISTLDDNLLQFSNLNQKVNDFLHGQRDLLIGLSANLISENAQELTNYLEQYGLRIEELDKINQTLSGFDGIFNKQLAAVRYLILDKIKSAREVDVTLTAEVSGEITDIPIPLIELVELLGIWLNNAIEEAQLTSEKRCHISFIQDIDPYGKEVLEIRVTNSCRENLPVDLDLLNEQGITSKGAGRGSGLRIVHDMVAKMEHVFTKTQIFEKEFIQLLLIELD